MCVLKYASAESYGISVGGHVWRSIVRKSLPSPKASLIRT